MIHTRHAGRVDANQAEIVKALRQIGCDVLSLAGLGNGAPDLLCFRAPIGYTLLEVKDPAQKPSARKLKPLQLAFHAAWQGPIHVVETVDDAVRVVTGQRL